MFFKDIVRESFLLTVYVSLIAGEMLFGAMGCPNALRC